jgi:uridine kinase
MPGAIMGIYGQQRSGKTLIAYKLVKGMCEIAHRQGFDLRVYTNLYCPKDVNFKYVNSIDELPLDLEPKVVLIDEIYNGCDAQDYRKLKDISIFINTIGKQNCLFVFTSIDAQMVYNRIRNQMSICVLVKSNASHIHYKFLCLNSGQESDYVVKKDSSLFENVFYDTDFIPLDFDWGMKSWREKLSAFYLDNYGISITL